MFLHSIPLFSCSFGFSSRVVLFWDTRSPPQNRQTKSHKGPVTSNPDNPFNYIHLTWKPFYKVTLTNNNNNNNNDNNSNNR